MLRISKLSRKKSASIFLGASIFGIIPTSIYLDYNKKIDLEKSTYKISKFLSGQIRSIRCGLTVGSIILDYKLNGISSKVHQNSADKLLHLCRLNKGTYVKVGQHVGALDMLLPEEYVQTMKCCFSDAPVSDFSDVKSVLCEDLKISSGDLTEIFTSFEEKPIGSASLAQVHKATLKMKTMTGSKEEQPGEVTRQVAVKVQHRLVYESAKRDVKIMDMGLDLANYMFPEFKFEWLVKLTKKNLFKELDFENEYNNTIKAKNLYEDKFKDFLIIPKVYKEFTTKRVLILDFETGTHIDKLPQVVEPGDQKRLNKAILNLQKLYGDMLFNTGFIHADPHPGNILVTKDDKIVLLDHGLYSKVDETFTYNFSQLWFSLITGDAEKVKKYCSFFNISGQAKTNQKFEMHEIFASMLMNEDYRDVIETKGLQSAEKSVGRNKGQKKLRKNVQFWMYDITEVLQAVPQEFVLIFKTNDLIRSLEYQFNCRANFNTYLSMSELCMLRIRDYKKAELARNLSDWLFNFKEYIKVQVTLLGLYFYKLTLAIKS